MTLALRLDIQVGEKSGLRDFAPESRDQAAILEERIALDILDDEEEKLGWYAGSETRLELDF